jgi:hypothetical protein
MNNDKKFSVLVLMLIWLYASAQVNYTSWTNGFISVNSYSGNTNPDAYTLQLSGNGNLNVPYWRLSARLTHPITSADGNYTMPANKLSFSPVSTSGSAFPNPVPTVQQIGMPLNVMMQEGQEVFLIPQSNAAIFNTSNFNAYYYLQLKYSFTIAGGSYLSNYPSWTSFSAPIQFTAYDRYNRQDRSRFSDPDCYSFRNASGYSRNVVKILGKCHEQFS